MWVFHAPGLVILRFPIIHFGSLMGFGINNFEPYASTTTLKKRRKPEFLPVYRPILLRRCEFLEPKELVSVKIWHIYSTWHKDALCQLLDAFQGTLDTILRAAVNYSLLQLDSTCTTFFSIVTEPLKLWKYEQKEFPFV